jgi:hypothetical protein
MGGKPAHYLRAGSIEGRKWELLLTGAYHSNALERLKSHVKKSKRNALPEVKAARCEKGGSAWIPAMEG